MVRTESVRLPLGTPAPALNLPDTADKPRALADLRGAKGLLVVWFCNHCPYAKAVQDRLLSIGADFIPRGLGMALVNSNDAGEYPDDSFANMQSLAAQRKFPFPYLYDETQAAAKRYKAACTPDPFLFDANLELYYHGRIDDGGRDAAKATTQDLRDAIDEMLAGRPAPEDQWNSIGCNIKWKGNVFPQYG